MKNDPTNTPQSNDPKKILNTDNSVVNSIPNEDEDIDSEQIEKEDGADKDEPVLDDVDLEENNISEDDTDDIEWDKPKTQKNQDQAEPGDKEQII